jgi:hypothetical protein
MMWVYGMVAFLATIMIAGWLHSFYLDQLDELHTGGILQERSGALTPDSVSLVVLSPPAMAGSSSIFNSMIFVRFDRCAMILISTTDEPSIDASDKLPWARRLGP